MIYIILFFSFIGIELLYFKIADAYNIIDKPNSRSSHTFVTLRGGGVIFPIAVLTAFFLGYVSWAVTFAVILVAVVSFIDDIKPLSQLPRFVSHAIAIGLIFYDLQLVTQAFWFIPVIFILFIGWVNAFNFMDGINGITVLYTLITLVSFSVLTVNQESIPLLITMGLSCCAFGIFNVRKNAKTFAGDVGSISMALFLGYYMIKTILDSGQVGYILFLSVYGIDAIITIFIRIKKKENILQPHRSHLYQYLANELQYSQILVSCMYAGIQLVINIFIIYLEFKGYLTIPIVIILLIMEIVFYLWLRKRIVRKIELKNGF